MRERLVAAFVLVALFTVVVFGVVRAYSLQGLIQRSETVRVQTSAKLLGTLVGEREDHGEPVTRAYLESLLGDDEWVRYVDPAGRATTATTPGAGAPSRDDVAHTVPVRGGGTVTFARSHRFVERAISDALLPVVLLGAGLAAVAAVLGFVLARRFARPFQDLAGVARELGRGRFDLEVPHYAIPEADAIGRALETSAAQLHDLVVREREFVLTASHQLNTPITALRLELEDLSLYPRIPAAASEQLQRSMAEVDRITAAVHDLLEVARQRKVGVTSDVDVTGLARSVAQRWQSAARDADRPLLVDGCAAPVHLAAGAVEQILDDLVRSALEHGSGPVRIDVEDLTDHVRVRVRDDSPPRVDVPAPARSVAEALGAHLTLDRGPTTSYTLRLPRAGVAAAVGGRPGPADGPIPTP